MTIRTKHRANSASQGRAWGSSLCLAGLLALSGSFAAVTQALARPDTSFEDKVVGESHLPDRKRVLKRDVVLRQIRPAARGSRRIELSLTERILAQPIQAEIVERATKRGVTGHGYIGSAISAVNIINPMSWAYGQNPVLSAQHGINRQLTEYRLTYRRPASATSGTNGDPVEFILPLRFAWVSVTTSASKILNLRFQSDRNGRISIPTRAIERLLAKHSKSTKPGSTVALTIAVEGQKGVSIRVPLQLDTSDPSS